MRVCVGLHAWDTMYVCIFVRIVRVYHSENEQDVEGNRLSQDLATHYLKAAMSSLSKSTSHQPKPLYSATHSSAQKSAISLNLSQPIKSLNCTNLSVAVATLPSPPPDRNPSNPSEPSNKPCKSTPGSVEAIASSRRFAKQSVTKKSVSRFMGGSVVASSRSSSGLDVLLDVVGGCWCLCERAEACFWRSSGRFVRLETGRIGM